MSIRSVTDSIFRNDLVKAVAAVNKNVIVVGKSTYSIKYGSCKVLTA